MVQARSQRFATDPDVRFYRIDELVSAAATDVSASGLFVSTQAWLPINGVVDVVVSLPGGSTVLMPARVAHCLTPDRAREVGRAHGMGFSLLNTGEREARLWTQYLRRLGSGLAAAHPERHRVMVVTHNRRLIERLINALQPVALELSFYDVRRPPLPFQLARGRDVLVVDAAHLNHPHVVRLCEHSTTPVLAVDCGGDEPRTGAWHAGANAVLGSPFTDRQLCDAIARLAPAASKAHLSGDLATIESTSVLSMLEYERRDGVLSLIGSGGSVRLVVADGHVCEVHGPRGMSRAAALRMALDFDEGRFEFRQLVSLAASHAERRPISAVLLEHAKHQDEDRFT